MSVVDARHLSAARAGSAAEVNIQCGVFVSCDFSFKIEQSFCQERFWNHLQWSS